MKKTERLVDWQEKEINDSNNDGIDDRIEPPIPDVQAGRDQLEERLRENTSTSPELSGGDVDAEWEMAESGGEETVGGSVATPGQNDVDEIGQALGVSYADDEVLNVGEKEEQRDRQRWELDPASSEDYNERTKGKG